MKIWVKRSIIGISGIAVLAGAISIGVTHGAYKNYNLVAAYVKAVKNEYGTSGVTLREYIKSYNSVYATLSKGYKDELAEEQKAFRAQYPTFEDYYSSSSSYSESLARADYNLNYSVSYYSNYSQAGVVAGSVFLVLGLVALIILMFIPARKNNTNENINSSTHEDTSVNPTDTI